MEGQGAHPMGLRGSRLTGQGPLPAVPGALVHRGPRLQHELVPGEEGRPVHVLGRGGPGSSRGRGRRPEPHHHLPQVRHGGGGTGCQGVGLRAPHRAQPAPPRLAAVWGPPHLTLTEGDLPTGKTGVRPGACCCGQRAPPAATATRVSVSGALWVILGDPQPSRPSQCLAWTCPPLGREPGTHPGASPAGPRPARWGLPRPRCSHPAGRAGTQHPILSREDGFPTGLLPPPTSRGLEAAP